MIDLDLPDQPAFTLKEVAQLFGLKLRSLEDAARADRIPHIHVGRQRIMTRAHVEQFFRDVEVVPEPAVRQATAAELAQEADLDRVRRRVAARLQKAGVR